MIEFIIGTFVGVIINSIFKEPPKNNGWHEIKSPKKPRQKKLNAQNINDNNILFTSDEHPIDNKNIIEFINKFNGNIQITTNIDNGIITIIPLDELILIKFPYFTWYNEYILTKNTFIDKFMVDNLCRKTTITKLKNKINKQELVDNYLLYRRIDDYYNQYQINTTNVIQASAPLI